MFLNVFLPAVDAVATIAECFKVAGGVAGAGRYTCPLPASLAQAAGN
jgi:hypothetical protein